MKGNQESMLYTTNATVAALNHVPGFDPLKFLRRTISRKTGEDVMRLDLRYKKLWFRLACPTGRLKLNALRITEKMAIFEAKVYRDREDAEPLSSYVANCTLDATPGGLYVEAAQEEALDTALSNAGFGICTIGTRKRTVFIAGIWKAIRRNACSPIQFVSTTRCHTTGFH